MCSPRRVQRAGDDGGHGARWTDWWDWNERLEVSQRKRKGKGP